MTSKENNIIRNILSKFGTNPSHHLPGNCHRKANEIEFEKTLLIKNIVMNFTQLDLHLF